MKKEFRIAALAAAITLSGCASDSDATANVDPQTNQAQLQEQISSFKTEINDAESALKAVGAKDLAWFATRQITDAKDALKEAKEYFSEYESDSSTMNNSIGLFTSTTYLQATTESLDTFTDNLNKAKSIYAETATVLEDALNYRKQLEKIDAKKHYPKTAQQLERQLKTLVDYMANDNKDRAIKSQPELVRKQHNLEVRTITKIYLSDNQKELQRQKTAGVAQHAPKTLRHAEAKLKASETFIATEPRAISSITQKAEETRFELAHSQLIATAVQNLKAMPDKDYERHILSYEHILTDISAALDSGDVRDQPVLQQGKHVVASIKANQKSQNDLVAALESQLAEAVMAQKTTMLASTKTEEVKTAAVIETIATETVEAEVSVEAPTTETVEAEIISETPAAETVEAEIIEDEVDETTA
ncbi:hypothetical protein C9J12_01265 [Photobacterium frigidiphilum]|uniref:DNA repair protein n=1 Tax=Photobacterium frigidiphilum TaxID=264736 RepID=A0A2T3JRE3_9GAMM|nr:hypothetical protein [Photobacterium frigidiphilum]PSU51608.1 hypothetical protein C9J12_01265 [Photobacterium frigidiphilum]